MFQARDDSVMLTPNISILSILQAGASEAAYNPDPKPETHKVSLDPYRRESAKILSIFKKMCPSGSIEKASIDESYFDLTIEVRKLILEKYPHLGSPPRDSPLGMDTLLPDPPLIEAWEEKGLGYLVPIAGEKNDAEETRDEIPENAAAPASNASGSTSILDEAFKEAAWSWTDVALSMGAELMARVRREVEEQLGYTTSAGIAPNKTLAKVSFFNCESPMQLRTK